MRETFDRIKQAVGSIPVLGPVLRVLYKLARFPLRPWLLTAEVRRIREHVERPPLLHTLAEMYATVEPYQPLYNVPLGDTVARRECADRARVIAEAVADLGSDFRMLDLGCSLGYFSFYFAERGARVEGIDSLAQNVNIARATGEYTRIGARFRTDVVNGEFVESVRDGEVDVTLALSLLHHIIHERGLDYAQRLLAALCAKVPVVFVELAVKQEPDTLHWQSALPEDPLETFRYVRDAEVTKIGEFPNHLSGVARPLYMIRRSAVVVNAHPWKVDRVTASAYAGATNFDREFFFGPGVFIKKYYVGGAGTPTGRRGAYRTENLRQIIQETANYNLVNGRSRHLPRLLDYEFTEGTITLVFERLDAENLRDVLAAGKPIRVRDLFVDVLAAVAELRSFGIYHNDLRTWNVMVRDNTPTGACTAFLIDLGYATFEERDDTVKALLVILWDLSHGCATTDVGWPIAEHWNQCLHCSRYVEDYDASVRDIATALIGADGIDDFLAHTLLVGPARAVSEEQRV